MSGKSAMLETVETQTAAPARIHWIPIFVAALIGRIAAPLIFFKFTPLPALKDWGIELLATALSLQAGHGFSSPFFSDTGPTALIAPGYVFLVAGMVEIFGSGSFGATMIELLQILFSLATLWLVMFTARRYFGDSAANIAGLIYALYPSMVVASVSIGDTTLSTLLFTVFFTGAATLYLGKWNFVPAGILCAIAALVSPALTPTLWIFCGWTAWKVKRIPWMGILAFAVVFSPWLIRNAIVMHAFIPIRADFGYQLNAGNHPGGDGNFVQSMNPMVDGKERMDFVAKGERRYLAEKGALARAYILSHKARFLELCFKRFIQFWVGIEGDGPPTTIPLLILAAGGLFLLRKRKWLLTLFLIPFIVYPLPYYITHTYMRFECELEPLFAILGGAAISALLVSSKRNQSEVSELVETGAAAE